VHLQERLTYIHAQPVHHDLVARAEDWPGLSSFRAVCDGQPTVDVAWLHEVNWRQAGGRREQISAHTSTVSIPITPLPMWQKLSERELHAARRAHERSVRDREREKAAERVASGHRSLGKPSRLTKTDPFSRPKGPPKRAPQPWAHGSSEAVAAFRAAYSAMIAAYREASGRFRTSGVLCEFPEGTFPPWVYSLSQAT